MQRPNADEYNPFYETYVSKVPDGDVLEVLARGAERAAALFGGLTEEQGLHRYAPGKWSVKEVLGHITDTERVMSYRALCVGRGDQTPLPAFDENAYIENWDFDRVSTADLLADFRSVREETIRLLRGFDDETARRRGTASGKPITVRALAYIIAGHEMHHRLILEERYGIAPARG